MLARHFSIIRNWKKPEEGCGPHGVAVRQKRQEECLEGQAQSIIGTTYSRQGCQMAKFDPFLSLDCAGVEGVGAQSKERKGSNFAA